MSASPSPTPSQPRGPSLGHAAAGALSGLGPWPHASQGGWEGGLGGLGQPAEALPAGCAPPQPAHDALQLLATLHQQQQALAAVQAAAAETLVAPHQALSARVHELLLLKQQLQQVVPPRPSGIRGTGPINNPLYKTELCRSWEELNSCRYGAKCQAHFAHGREELRPVVRHPKYKTEICRTFAQNGTCPYGTRCRFIHTTCPSSPAPSPATASGAPTAAATPTASSRDESFSSLTRHSLGMSAPTPPLAARLPRAAMPRGTTNLPVRSTPDVSAASLLGLPVDVAFGGTAPAMEFGCSLGDSFGAVGSGVGATAAYAADDVSNMLAALGALLSNTQARAASPLPAGPALTTAAAAASALGMGVVGTPVGLPAIGVGTAMPAASAAQLPSCPATPLGTSATGVLAAMRRSLSDSGVSTPGGSTKRLPFFEQLTPEGGDVSTTADFP